MTDSENFQASFETQLAARFTLSRKIATGGVGSGEKQMVTTGLIGQNHVISKSLLCFQVANLEASAKQQVFRVENAEDQLRLVSVGSSLGGRPTELDHRHCASELGYAERTARIWSGCY
ncbi:hypothetical protein [Paracoccus acridae]|uniref:hypothetical protein n=1 Tax=Paracoccus acridae TaxID=1795310 RepID=UPI00166DDA2F|nr:hypothetical protein [Paracoccus acridae]